jgi:hypothetical protein
MIRSFRLGAVEIRWRPEGTLTRFPGGLTCLGFHRVQPGQREVAEDWGIGPAKRMNEEHDVTHSLLAYWLRLPYSPSLMGAAKQKRAEVHREEESAVLALQRYARALNLDLVQLAQSYGRGE